MAQFNHFELSLLNPRFDSPLVDALTELELLRHLRLETDVHPPSWIPALRVDKAQPLHGEEVVQVWLGVENGKKLHLEAFMRLEDNNWKIYRVRDITNNYEHPIFKKP